MSEGPGRSVGIRLAVAGQIRPGDVHVQVLRADAGCGELVGDRGDKAG